jgi:riboflavin synthase
MFTGIVQALGRVAALDGGAHGARLHIDAGGLDMTDVALGDSIAVDGCCLTVVAFDGAGFQADVSRETLDCTAGFAAGGRVNLEKALRAGERLGGHLVTGHVDGVSAVVAITPDGESRRFEFRLPAALAKFVARKGSVTVNGVSLTVNEAGHDRFAVNLIPHTLAMTNLGALRPDDRVNLEVDLIARYVERMLTGDPQALAP